MSLTNTSRLVSVRLICLFLILLHFASRDDQKTPSTEIFLDENRLSGIIIHSETILFNTDRFRPNADLFCISVAPGLAIVSVDVTKIHIAVGAPMHRITQTVYIIGL